MGEEHHPSELWQHEQTSESHVQKVVTKRLMLLARETVWLAIAFSVRLFFLR